MKLAIKYLIAFILFFVINSFFYLFADVSHIVKKGDTLYSLGRKYEITVAELCAANNLNANDVLHIGQKLVIPNADIGTAAALSGSLASSYSGLNNTGVSLYTVSKGDTLYGIARKHDIKLPELLTLNGLDSNSTIKIGQQIKVPAIKKIEESVKNSDLKPSVIANNSLQLVTSDSEGKWPLSKPLVKKIDGKAPGVQLTGQDNEAVVCIQEGTVMYTGVYRGFGDIVFVQSKTGLIYAYCGMDSVKAKKGDYITTGTELGTVGKGNAATLKFMVFQNGSPIDPAKAPRG